MLQIANHKATAIRNLFRKKTPPSRLMNRAGGEFSDAVRPTEYYTSRRLRPLRLRFDAVFTKLWTQWRLNSLTAATEVEKDARIPQGTRFSQLCASRYIRRERQPRSSALCPFGPSLSEDRHPGLSPVPSACGKCHRACCS